MSGPRRPWWVPVPVRTRELWPWLILGALAAILGGGGVAQAGGVAVLTDSRVAQYREAQAAAKELLRESPVLETSAQDIVQQLERVSPAVVLAIGQKALQTAQQVGATVVFCMVLGPSAASSRSVTGLRLEVAPDAQLDSFRRVYPTARRLGVIYDAKTWSGYLADATRAAAGRGFTLVPKPVADGRDVRAALNDLAGDIDALWLIPDPQLISAEMFNFLLVFTLEHKIALFGFFESFTRAGALASVAPDYAAIGRQAAKLAADLAAKPDGARLPVPPSVASPGVLTINVRTARQLGIDIAEDVQARAKQVYR